MINLHKSNLPLVDKDILTVVKEDEEGHPKGDDEHPIPKQGM